MFKIKLKTKLCFSYNLLAAALILAAGFVRAEAQDTGGNLGSSTGLFRSMNPVTKSSAPRRRAAPRRAVPESVKKIIKISAKRNAAEKPKNNRLRKASILALRIKKKRETETTQTLENAIAEGSDARDARIFINAEHAYWTANKINPNDWRPLFGVGNVYADQQRWDEAEAVYRQALDLEPSAVAVNLALSSVLLQPNRGGNTASRFDEAEAFARRAVQINPTAAAHDQLGVALELRGVTGDESEAEYRRAIARDKNFALAYAHLGRLQRKKGNAESAESYRQASETAQDVPTMLLIAEVLQSDNQFAESEKLLTKAFELNRGNSATLLLLGRAQAIRGDFAAAESSLIWSVRLNPRNFAGYSALGTVYLRQEKFADAERVYQEALAFASDAEKQQIAGVYGFTGIGDGYLRRGSGGDALRVYRMALEIDGGNSTLNAKIAAVSNDNH